MRPALQQRRGAAAYATLSPMPVTTFWNQVRLITPALEPLITLFQGQSWDGVICWPLVWGDSLPSPVTPLIETPPLSLVRQPLPWRVRASASAKQIVIQLVPLTPEAHGLDDTRVWAAIIETLAGSGASRVLLLGDGVATVDNLPPFVTLKDHLNFAQENILVGYPAEAETPSRFIDTQTLYHPIDGVEAVTALHARVPQMQTPAELALARQLGAQAICGDLIQLALLCHFHKMRVTAGVRLDPSIAHPFQFTQLHPN